MDLSQRLDEMELAIHKPSFRKGTGRANEVNYESNEVEDTSTSSKTLDVFDVLLAGVEAVD